MKHTKGKWYPVDYAGTLVLQASPVYGEPDLFDYCELHDNYFEEEEAKSNINLASKAPEMYQALKTIRTMSIRRDNGHFDKPDHSQEIELIDSLLKEIES